MGVQFTAPALLVLLVAVAWFWYVARHGSRRQLVNRCAIIVLLVLAAAGLQMRWRAAALHVAFVVDRSASVPLGDVALLRRVSDLAGPMHSDDSAAVVSFGGDALVERTPTSRLSLTRFTTAPDRTGTNIETALQTALGLLPADGAGRIVLLSDGRETDGQATAPANDAAASHVPVDVVDIGASRSGGMAVTRVRAPSVARINEPFVITATVTGPPGGKGLVALSAAGSRADERGVTFDEDGFATMAFDARGTSPGAHTYRLQVRDPQDDANHDAADADAGAVVIVSGEPRVLYVGAPDAALERAIGAAGFTVTHLSKATEVPDSAARLSDYDAIVLDDVGAPALDVAQSSAIARYVDHSGGGLLVLGSPSSLTAAIPEDHPFRELLPVDLRPRGGRRAPAAALVVVFDKSGSMDDRVGGIPKIELARQAILRVVDAMPGSDAVGVIAFDATPVPIAPLSSSSDRTQLADRLGRLRPAGSTALAPALSLARQWLQRPEFARVERRHVLLVSDGRTAAGDAAAAEAAVKDQGFELTAIAVSGGDDPAFLTRLAGSTGGRALFPADARELPFLLAREASRVTGGANVEETFVPHLLAHPIVTGLGLDRAPRLGGYVVATARPPAAIALSSHLDDPILATWQYGLGRVALYTAGLRTPWSAAMRGWNGYAPLFVRTTNWVSRRMRDGRLYARIGESEGRTRLTLEASSAEGGRVSLLEARASIMDPSGQVTSVALDETSPGLYQSLVPARSPGPYVVTISASDPQSGFNAQVVRGFYRSASRELTPSENGGRLLAELSAITGGRQLKDDQSPFTGPRPAQYVDLRNGLLAAALSLFLLEILGPLAMSLVRTFSRRSRTASQAEAA